MWISTNKHTDSLMYMCIMPICGQATKVISVVCSVVLLHSANILHCSVFGMVSWKHISQLSLSTCPVSLPVDAVINLSGFILCQCHRCGTTAEASCPYKRAMLSPTRASQITTANSTVQAKVRYHI